THINPDGDGIGSEVAFARWLESLGKSVRILNDSVTPSAFLFLTDENPIEVFEAEPAERRFAEADALVVLDTSNRQRIGRLAPLIDRHEITVGVIDHHVTHAQGFGQVNVIEPEVAATGELIYDLIREAGGALDRTTGQALYVALMTDTGGFRYSNTDSHAHRMAAELLGLGLDPEELHARVHANAPAGRLRFFGEALAGLEVLEEGRLIVLEVAPEQFQRHGLVGADTEGLVDMPRAIAGVEVVALFSEVESGKVKVSLRSTGRVSIDQVCSRLGGGGHPHAAGVLLRGTRQQARERILPGLRALLELPAEAGDAGRS
ncbi:MAG: DHH family phosphoesterase, partial [Candidatus Eisenbacteria bacterium]|nr:DHH family phosphoesterase [Candidatus Eisenbacteria bacterium]